MGVSFVAQSEPQGGHMLVLILSIVFVLFLHLKFLQPHLYIQRINIPFA